MKLMDILREAKYQGRDVTLNKPTRGDTKKSKVYVNSGKKNKDGTIKVKKVEFGHKGKDGEKTMKIKKSNPNRRKSFRARHNCDNPGPKTKARYWSCKAW
jgi:hypothetical protein